VTGSSGASRPVCPLCSGVERVPVIDIPPWSVVACPRCRLGLLDPPLSPEQAAALYDESFYYDNRMVAAPEAVRQAIAGQRPRVRYLQRFRRGGDLLEIGAGMGYLLAAAREAGFRVKGLELSPWAAAQAREVLGLDIASGGVESAAFAPASFDVIVMWHVIEHFVDPLANLRRLRAWLRPGGVLILETRNYTGYDARQLGREWNGWSLPHHLWHFSPRSLRRALEATGFAHVRARADHSAIVKQRVRNSPLSFLRNPVSRLFPGSNVRAIGWAGVEP
jgi:2-polyprenyl-3-methyl-5-hydroxy-6-metoxy-1,4-benzoquinol methylase